MAKIHEKEQAIQLRKQGCSIGEIATELSVSKSTVSGWCRDITLSAAAQSEIARKGNQKSVAGLLRYSESIRQKRIEATEASMKRGEHRIGLLNERDLYCIGLGLYWGEGYKRGSQEFGFSNSDPKMILFYIAWLKACFGLSRKNLILRVSINATHQERENDVLKYWSALTAVPKDQFTKTSFIRSASKKQYQNHDAHFGTLRIKVRKGTTLRREVLGAIAAISRFKNHR